MKEKEFYTLSTFNPSTDLIMVIIISGKFLPKDEQSEKELMQILDMSNRLLEDKANTNYIFN